MDPEELKKQGNTVDPAKLKGLSGTANAAWKTIWSAGQSTGNIRDIPTVAQLIDQLKREYAQAQLDLAHQVNPPPPAPPQQKPPGPAGP